MGIFINQPPDNLTKVNGEVAMKKEAYSSETIPVIYIYDIVFFNGEMVLTTNDRDDFWLEISKRVGWIKFERLREAKEINENAALFLATELRQGSETVPCSAVRARCVLSPRREALLSAAKMSPACLDLAHYISQKNKERQ